MTSDRKASARVAFQYRDYRLYQMARLLSIVGTEMAAVAVAWQVYQITHRALDLGLVGLVQFLPGVLLSMVGGHTADRFDRRAVMMWCYGGFALCAALLTVFSVRGTTGVMPIYVVLTVLGIVRAFSGPTSQALTPSLVPTEHFPNAVAWSSTIFQIATITGPALGGLIYGWTGGPTTVYIGAVLMYAVALTRLAAMKVRTGRMEKREASWGTLLAGFRYVWEQKVILGSVSLDLFAVLLGGATALLPIFAKDILHVGPFGLGLLRSAPAVGAGVMAVTMAHRPLTRRTGPIMLMCVAIFGAATIAFGFSRSFWSALVALIVVGASDNISVFVRATVVQLATPPEMRGRVSAVNMMAIGASNELGQFESGITAQWFGAVPAVMLGGVGSIVIVLLWTWLFPALRQVDRLVVTPEIPRQRASGVAAGKA